MSFNIKITRRKLTGVCTAALLLQMAGCATIDELNSERIRRLYGNYGVEVLTQTDVLRVTNLFSRADGLATCRTLAIVRFAPEAAANFSSAHAAIQAGASIGETLAQDGWTLEKTTRRLEAFNLTSASPLFERLMRIPAQSTLALHVYDLNAMRDGVAATYASIAELHHPDYWSASELADHLRDAPVLPPTGEDTARLDALITRISRGDLE